jgi:hypothetical protein
MTAYEHWRKPLVDWVETRRATGMALHTVCEEISDGLQLQGHQVSPFALRRHILGRHQDISLERAVAITVFLETVQRREMSNA